MPTLLRMAALGGVLAAANSMSNKNNKSDSQPPPPPPPPGYGYGYGYAAYPAYPPSGYPPQRRRSMERMYDDNGYGYDDRRRGPPSRSPGRSQRPSPRPRSNSFEEVYDGYNARDEYYAQSSKRHDDGRGQLYPPQERGRGYPQDNFPTAPPPYRAEHEKKRVDPSQTFTEDAKRPISNSQRQQ